MAIMGAAAGALAKESIAISADAISSIGIPRSKDEFKEALPLLKDAPLINTPLPP